MRAGLLNGAMGATDARVNIPQVGTDDPALDGQPAELPSTGSPTFNVATFQQFVSVAAALDAQGVIAVEDEEAPFSWAELSYYAGIGATLGSVVPGVGTAIGALVGALVYVVAGIFEGYPANITTYNDPNYIGSSWYQWAMAYTSESFRWWMEYNFPDLVFSNPGVQARMQLYQWLEYYGKVATYPGGWLYEGSDGPVPNSIYLEWAGPVTSWGGDDGTPMPPQGTPEFFLWCGQRIYAPFGVDYKRTMVEAYPAGTEIFGLVSQGTGLVYQRNLGQYGYIPGAVIETEADTSPLRQTPLVRRDANATLLGVGGAFAILALLSTTSIDGNKAQAGINT